MTDEVPGYTKFLLSLAKVEDYFSENPIPHNKTVRGKGFSYGYTDLATLLRTLRPILSKNKLVLFQSFSDTVEPEGTRLNTTLRHTETGEGVSSSSHIPTGRMKPQEQGSYFTYARRYHIMALLGIHPAPDDDGAVPGKVGGEMREMIGEEEIGELRELAKEHKEKAISLMAKRGYKSIREIPKEDYGSFKKTLALTIKEENRCKK